MSVSTSYRTAVVATLIIGIGILIVGLSAQPLAATQSPNSSGGGIVSITHDETVPADGSFDITVETSNSAGTTVTVEPTGVDTEVSSGSGTVEANQVRFLDVNAGDSTHTVAVDIIGGEDGGSVEIAAWVNAGDRDDADDVATSTIDVETTEDSTSESDGTSDETDTNNNEDSNDEMNEEPEPAEDVESKENNEQTSSSANQNNETTSGGEQSDNNENETSRQADEKSNTQDPAEGSGPEAETGSSIPGFGIITSITALVWYTIARLSRRWTKTNK